MTLLHQHKSFKLATTNVFHFLQNTLLFNNAMYANHYEGCQQQYWLVGLLLVRSRDSGMGMKMSNFTHTFV